MADQTPQQFLAEARAHERHHRLPAAVAGYLGAGQWQEAARLLSHLGHFYEAGLALLLYLPARPQEVRKLPAEQRRRAMDAALCFARGGARREAVGLLMNLNQTQKAANLLVRAGMRSDAVRAMRGEPFSGNPWPPGVVFPLYTTDDLLGLLQQTLMPRGSGTYDPTGVSQESASESVSVAVPAPGQSSESAEYVEPEDRTGGWQQPGESQSSGVYEPRAATFEAPPARAPRNLSGSYDRPPPRATRPDPGTGSDRRASYEEAAPRGPAAGGPGRPGSPPGEAGLPNFDFAEGEIPPPPPLPRPPAPFTRGPANTRRVVMPDPSLSGDLSLTGDGDYSDDELEMAERSALVGPGTLIGDRYEVQSLIGAGGMASVYKAYDRELQEEVALKMFRVVVDDPVRLRRFRREMKLHRRLVHPNIVQTFEFGTWNGARYITMELLEGEEFHDFIQENKHLEPGRKLNLMMQVCDGLGEAHKQSIVHRDIKPANLFVVDGGKRIKVMDFGIAKAVDSSTISITGVRVGTPRYMSPEQIQGNNDEIGVGSDLYSLGAVMYELFTGRAVFTDDDLMPLLLNHLSERPEPPSQVNPAVPRVVEDIIMRLLEKDPKERYPDATTVKSALLRAYVQTQQL